MRRIYLLAIPLILVVSGLFDIATPPPTTDSELAMANSYLAVQNLPPPPNPFTHDGCTLFFDRVPFHDFRSGCLAHDIAYWAGGDSALKTEADRALRESARIVGPIGYIVAPIIYTGVQYFGDSALTTLLGANWGYGWNI